MESKFNILENYIQVDFDGRLDISTAPIVEKELEKFLSQGHKNFLINGAKLNYVSSAGLRVFLFLIKATKKQQGSVVLAQLQKNVAQVFEISGFNSIVPIHPTLEAAKQAFE